MVKAQSSMDDNQRQQTETSTWINPASSIEFQASMNSKELRQKEFKTGMKQEDYNAAAEGNILHFEDAHYPSDLLLTPSRNTILHIYITSLSKTKPESKTQFVKKILNMCPRLLGQRNAEGETSEAQFIEDILKKFPQLVRQCNAKGETPLHIAARYGHATIVKVLIEGAKASLTELESQVDVAREVLGMTNNEGDTALHEAVRFNHHEVVILLLEEDQSFSYSANKAGETLLYMAVERSFEAVTYEILNKSTSPAYTGPLGRTVLHAAVFWNEKEIIKKMSEKIGFPTELADHKGWTPLHLAAYFNCCKAVTQLLKDYGQMAYMQDANGRTALHIAAYRGHHKVVSEIISSYPDCCELIDKKGWNALHFSVKGKRSLETMEIFLNNPSFSNLLNEKDLDGNTALHHHFKSPRSGLWSLVSHPRIDKLAFNNQNLNILDIVSLDRLLVYYKGFTIRRLSRENIGLRSSRRVATGRDCIVKPENEEEEEEEWWDEKLRGLVSSAYKKIDKAYPIVATLISTVSFTAGITMPGGFVGQDGPDPGSAVLARGAAFKAFVVTDSVAFLLSTWAVFAYAFRSLPHFEILALSRIELFLASSTLWATLWALVAMFLAFVTGTYAVLVHHYSDIAIATWTVVPFLLSIILGRISYVIFYFPNNYHQQ